MVFEEVTSIGDHLPRFFFSRGLRLKEQEVLPRMERMVAGSLIVEQPDSALLVHKQEKQILAVRKFLRFYHL